MKKESEVFRKFKETIRRYRLFRDGNHILLAYSGGADSTALLLLLLELRQAMTFDLSLAHFNHKLRPSAEKDAHWAKLMARKYGLRIHAGSGDVRSYARRHGLNIEEAGRVLRYRFLIRAAGRAGATKIATAHTMTDQAETFLMRLLRGSGPRGLGGIFPEVGGMIIRPLIEVEREEVERFLRDRTISYCTDESNRDRRFLRNRVRLSLIPYIRRHFEPGVVPLLGRAAAILREDDGFLENAAGELSSWAIKEHEGNLFLDMKFLESLHTALARRCVREFIARIKGNLRAVTFKDVECVLRLTEGKEFRLRKGIVLRREKGLVSKKDAAGQKMEKTILWDGRGILMSPETGFRFRGRKLKNNPGLSLPFDDDVRAHLDLGTLEFPLLVRGRREGDRYRPLGAPGAKKLKEILRSKGIPLAQRDRLPVFFSAGEIVWVPGLPVAEKFRVKESTSTILIVEKL